MKRAILLAALLPIVFLGVAPSAETAEPHHLVVGLGRSGERSAHDRLRVGLIRGRVHLSLIALALLALPRTRTGLVGITSGTGPLLNRCLRLSDPVGRPVDHFRSADDVVPRHEAPSPRVA